MPCNFKSKKQLAFNFSLASGHGGSGHPAGGGWSTGRRLSPVRQRGSREEPLQVAGGVAAEWDVSVVVLKWVASARTVPIHPLVCVPSRAFIRWACADDELPVPSPTYLLQNTYENEAGKAGDLVHVQ